MKNEYQGEWAKNRAIERRFKRDSIIILITLYAIAIIAIATAK